MKETGTFIVCDCLDLHLHSNISYALNLHFNEIESVKLWWLFTRVWEFLENVGQFILHLHFFFFLFLKWRLGCAHYFHSLGQDQSTVAHQAETTVAECSLTSCVWVHFQISSHTMPARWLSQPTPTLLGHGSMHVLDVTCHLHFWQNDWDLLHATALTRRMEWTLNKSRHTNSGEENSPAALAGIRTHNHSITCLALLCIKEITSCYEILKLS